MSNCTDDKRQKESYENLLGGREDWPSQGGHSLEAWAEILALVKPREERKCPATEGFPWGSRNLASSRKARGASSRRKRAVGEVRQCRILQNMADFVSILKSMGKDKYTAKEATCPDFVSENNHYHLHFTPEETSYRNSVTWPTSTVEFVTQLVFEQGLSNSKLVVLLLSTQHPRSREAATKAVSWELRLADRSPILLPVRHLGTGGEGDAELLFRPPQKPTVEGWREREDARPDESNVWSF